MDSVRNTLPKAGVRGESGLVTVVQESEWRYRYPDRPRFRPGPSLGPFPYVRGVLS